MQVRSGSPVEHVWNERPDELPVGTGWGKSEGRFEGGMLP